MFIVMTHLDTARLLPWHKKHATPGLGFQAVCKQRSLKHGADSNRKKGFTLGFPGSFFLPFPLKEFFFKTPSYMILIQLQINQNQ